MRSRGKRRDVLSSLFYTGELLSIQHGDET